MDRLDQELGEDISNIIKRCLKRDPEKRFRNGIELYDNLKLHV